MCASGVGDPVRKQELEQYPRSGRAKRPRSNEVCGIILRLAVDQTLIHAGSTHHRHALLHGLCQRVADAARCIAVAETRQHDPFRAAIERLRDIIRRHARIGIEDGDFGHIFKQAVPRRFVHAPGRAEPFERCRRNMPDRTTRKPLECIDIFGVRLARIAGCKNAVAHDQQNASTRCILIARNPHRIGKIAHPVAAHRIGSAHRTHQYYRFGRRQRLIKQKGGFLCRIGAVGYHDPAACIIAHRLRRSRMEPLPQVGTDIFRPDIGKLFANQLGRDAHSGQLCQKRIDSDLPRPVILADRRSGDTGNRSAGRKYLDMLLAHAAPIGGSEKRFKEIHFRN